ncbi:MAG: cytochrome c [Paludibacter sp.]|nr:cytochrome c [Paludibacter sp.]
MISKFLIGLFSLTGFLLISTYAVAAQPKGMITTVEMGPINPVMVKSGKGLFTSKCAMCHDLDQKRVGPSLRNITKVRKPEYIMNVIYNTVKMQKSDPIFKSLLVKFNNVPMPDPNLSKAQVRTILEYLRSVAK